MPTAGEREALKAIANRKAAAADEEDDLMEQDGDDGEGEPKPWAEVAAGAVSSLISFVGGGGGRETPPGPGGRVPQ